MLKKLINSSDLNYQRDQSPVINKKLFNHRFFCVYIKSYFLLKHTIKFIDIELLKYVIRNCIIMFQAKIDNVF